MEDQAEVLTVQYNNVHCTCTCAISRAVWLLPTHSDITIAVSVVVVGCRGLQEWGVSQDMVIETLTREGLGTWLEKGISNVAFLSLGLGLDNTASRAFTEAKVRAAQSVLQVLTITANSVPLQKSYVPPKEEVAGEEEEEEDEEEDEADGDSSGSEEDSSPPM